MYSICNGSNFDTASSKSSLMNQEFPIRFNLHDGTHVEVYQTDADCYEFYLTRLNSEKHNFLLVSGKIEESYETRFDLLQNEAVEIFQKMLQGQLS